VIKVKMKLNKVKKKIANGGRMRMPISPKDVEIDNGPL